MSFTLLGTIGSIRTSVDRAMKISFQLSWFFFTLFIFKNVSCLPASFNSNLYQPADDIKKVVDHALGEEDIDQKMHYELVFCGAPQRMYRELYTLCLPYWKQSDCKKALQETLLFLKRKKTIQSVHISFIATVPGHCLVVCNLTCATVLRSLRFKGMVREKDMYRHYYMMHVGDPFVFEKHAQSVARIERALREQGYKKAKVLVEFDEKKDDASVALVITCNRGMCHSIAKVSVVIRGEDAYEIDSEVQAEIQAFMQKHLYKKKYSLELLNAQTVKLKQLLMKKGFFKVKITVEEAVSEKNTHVALTFSLEVERPKPLIFRGNYFFSDDYFLKKIKVFSDIMHSIPASLLVQELQAEYLKKGFFDVSIAHDDHVDNVTFFIAEGKRFRVRDIVIKGADTYDASALKNKFFYRVLHKSYDEDILKKAIDRLITFYHDAGFLHCVITKKITKKEEHDGSCVFTFYVQENVSHHIASVTIQEPFEYLLLKGPFRRFHKMKNSIPFSQKIIVEQQQWLVDYFKKEGFLNVKVTAEKRELKNDFVIHWKIDLGKKVSFGSIIIDGYTAVPYKTLCQTVRLAEGEAWSKDTMRSMYESLKTLDVFKHVALVSEYSLSQENVRDIVVRVEDNYPFEGRLRLGFQQMSKNLQFKNGSTYKVGGTLLYRNLRSIADTLRLDADVTRFERAIALAYHVPALFDAPIKTIFKGYLNKYIQPIAVGVNKPLYEAQERGFFISCAGNYKKMDSAFTAGLEWSKTKDLSERLARAIHFEPILIDKSVPSFFVETTSFFDWLDNTLQPHKGIYGVLTAKGLVPFKTGVSFFRFLAETGIFFPIVPDLQIIVALRGRLGHIFTQDFTKMMPVDRFYLGGSTTIRGYQQDECPPLGFYEDNNKIYFVPQGGASVVCANIEFRIPFVSNYGSVVFHDIGTLAGGSLPPSFAGGGGYYSATGCGFRYETPLSVFRFDIGWKWQKQYPQEKRYAWFLAFGQAF